MARARPDPARVPLLRRLVYAVAMLVLTLLALEGAARVGLWLGIRATLPPEVVEWIDNEDLVFDPVLGWAPATGMPQVEQANYTPYAFELDQMALPEGTIRGYTFGDSQTRGAGVAQAQSYPIQMETQLRAKGWKVRVTNLASSGFRSAQALQLIESYASRQHPAFFVVDCMYRDSEPLARDYDPDWMWARRLLFESRAYRLLRLGVAKARGQNTGPQAPAKVETPPPDTGHPTSTQVGNHQAIADLARALDVPLLFVDYPFFGKPAQALAPAKEMPVGVPVVAATAALNADGRPMEELFLENNHLSAAGNAVVATKVVEALEPILRERHPDAYAAEPQPPLPQAGAWAGPNPVRPNLPPARP